MTDHSSPDSQSDERSVPAQRSAVRDNRLAAWFEQWRKPVSHWLLRRSAVPASDIDDLAQEVFLRLLRYSENVAVANPQGYLFRIAANVANEWQERVRNRQPHEQSWLSELQVETGEEPENVVGQTMVQERVQAVVQKLPARQREVLLLHVDDGLTCAQIARHMGLTHRAVQRDLVRAYSRLRLRLNLEDLSSMNG